MRSPLFSVIIPTFGRPAFLAEAIGSTLAQSVEDFECIVVDDASPAPADTPDDPRVRRVRRDENGGPAAARNTGMAVALGRYLAFLDDDDLFMPDRLAHAMEGLRRAPVSICWRSDLPRSSERLEHFEGDVSDSILDGLTPSLGQVAIERSLAPAFDERFLGAEDVEWWLRVAGTCTVATVPRVGVVYRLHSGSRNRSGLDARVRGSLLLLETHSEYFARHRRAAAFRWKRIGLMARSLGDHALARRAFRRALALRPELATAWHLLRSLRPSTDTTPLADLV
ncbi:MAG: glycosyltransferase family 2 protein [Actinomycetota bacterium]